MNVVSNGAGTLTLSGAHTYTGTTSVSAGTLLVTGSLGAGSYGGAVTLSGGTLAFNQSAAQTLSGGLTLTANSTLTNRDYLLGQSSPSCDGVLRHARK